MFPEGSPIIVTYYHQNFSEIDVKTMPTDISPMAHPVHKDFTKILNFEMRLLEPLSPSFVEEDNSFDITGEAITYPGFIPHIGDEFFLDMGDGKIGEFKVNNVTPTSYRQGKYHKVNFEILNYVTAQIVERLDAGSRDTVYFDKNVYVGEGDYVFLKATSYVQLQELKKRHKELIQFYMNKFYSEAWESFLRPDGIYDPYVVEFLRQRLSIRDSKRRPSQLYTRLTDYHKSIWYLFTDSEYTQSLDGIGSIAYVNYLQADALSTDLNALINRYFILLGEGNNQSPYVFSEHFYSGNTPSMTPLEKLVYSYITTRTINIASALELISEYRVMSTINQFYFIPILIELVVVSIDAIKN